MDRAATDASVGMGAPRRYVLTVLSLAPRGERLDTAPLCVVGLPALAVPGRPASRLADVYDFLLLYYGFRLRLADGAADCRPGCAAYASADDCTSPAANGRTDGRTGSTTEAPTEHGSTVDVTCQGRRSPSHHHYCREY